MTLKTTLTLTVIATLIILSAGCIDNTTETEYMEFTDTDGDGITDPYDNNPYRAPTPAWTPHRTVTPIPIYKGYNWKTSTQTESGYEQSATSYLRGSATPGESYNVPGVTYGDSDIEYDVPAGPPTPDMEQTVESTLESDPIVTTGATSGIELTIPDVPTIETLVCDIVENVDSRASSTAELACDRGFFIESNYDYDAGVAILSTKQSYYYIAQTWVTIGGTRFIIDPQTNFYWNETDHETEFGESYKIEFVPVKKGTELVKSCTDYWAIF